MQKNFIHIILIVSVLLTFGCLDSFTFERVDNDTSIVVDGQFTTSKGPHIVRISNVLAFGDKFFDPVPGISVTLHDGEKSFQFLEESPGIHVIPEGVIRGIPGKEYYISMILPDGNIVRSNPEIMPEEYALKSVDAVFKRENIITKSGIERRDRIIEVTVNAEFPEINEGAEFYLRYRVDEDFSYSEVPCGGLHQLKSCYVHVPSFSNDFALFESALSSKTTIDSLVVFKKGELVGTNFRGKHYFNVYQISITPEAYEYWLRVKEVTNQEGTVFDKPPALVPGNLTSETDPDKTILGYFELAAIDLKRKPIIPSEYFAGSTDSDECSVFNRRNWPDRCCQCLNIKNATTIRPPWF